MSWARTSGLAQRALAMSVAAVAGATVSVAVALPAQADEVYPRPADGVITFAGHGYGHGHGMSQWGAHGAASRGQTWQQIIQFYYPNTSVQDIGNPPMRVRLDALGSSPLYVANASGLTISTGPSGSPQAVPVLQDGSSPHYYRLTAQAGGTIVLAGGDNGVYQDLGAYASPIEFSNPANVSQSDPVGTVTVLLPGGKPRTYPGQISSNWSNGGLMTVDAAPMETYLRGVVPSEMPTSWEMNALAAQAVAARSYANYDRASAPAGRLWDTCDTTWCQVFSGVSSVLPTYAQTFEDAMNASARQTILYGGKAAFTQFSASNGGWMAAGSQPAYLVAKPDPYDGAIANSANSWSASVAVSKVEAAFPTIGSYRDMRVTARDGHGEWGGRITSVVFEGSAGSVTVSGDTARGKLGLRSEWFIPTNPLVVTSAPSFPRDFTGDAKADVLAAEAGTGNLRLYPGNGAGGWQPMRVIGSGGWNGFAKLFTAGTWDGDAVPDVMAQRRDGALLLYPGASSGALGAPQVIGSGWNVHNLVFPVGDFSGDGATDLIARRASDGALFLYSGNGVGGFLSSRQVGAGWNIFNAVWSPGDFTGDGKPDVLARAKDGTLYLYPGNGAGGWQPRRLVGRSWNVFSAVLSAGDFDGDGRSDVLARTWDGTLYLYPGNGAGGWLPRRVVGRGWNIFSTILP